MLNNAQFTVQFTIFATKNRRYEFTANRIYARQSKQCIM
jgi:hypothetical protein